MIVSGVGYAPDGTADGSAPAIEDAKAPPSSLACSEGRISDKEGSWRPVGDPMEAAIHTLAMRLHVADEPAPPDPTVRLRHPTAT